MDLENLTAQEKEFKRALDASGIPTTDEQFRAEWQQMADEANVPIANPSKFSAFWVFVSTAITEPARWLIAFMIRHVMPNMYVPTASAGMRAMITSSMMLVVSLFVLTRGLDETLKSFFSSITPSPPFRPRPRRTPRTASAPI